MDTKMVRSRIKTFALLLLLSVGVGSVGKAASFDCNKATTETEIAICSDPELSALDELMSVVYKQAIRSNDWRYDVEDRDDSSIISKQRASLVKQLKCKSDRYCLSNYYRVRIKDLLIYIGLDLHDTDRDFVGALLEFLKYVSDKTDIRSIGLSEANDTAVLYISDAGPKNISRGASGTVYNNNPSMLVIAFTNAKKVREIALLEGPSSTDLGANLNVYNDKVTLNEEYTRGWLSTSYSYGVQSDDWVLSQFESNTVTSPGAGRFIHLIEDYSNNVVITKVGYIFAGCDIPMPPNFIGDNNFWHIEQMPGYSKLLNVYDELKSNHIGFLQGLHDRDLYTYSASAFEIGNFDLSLKGFEILNQRVQSDFQERISEGYGENRFPRFVRSALDCVKLTAKVD